MYHDALNGDRVAREEFARLVQNYQVRSIVETGTYHGVTTEYLASLVPLVHSIEIDLRYQAIARERVGEDARVKLHLGNSPQVLSSILPTVPQPTFFFLDAHWGSYCPLLDELRSMAAQGVHCPVIAVHDIFVPGTTLGHDTHDGEPFSLEYLEPVLPPLYPRGYRTHYNDDSAEGARRGILYVTPAEL